ncbi:MAG: hypothetical protein ACP5R5_09845 [Armatimonadota bacterium]
MRSMVISLGMVAAIAGLAVGAATGAVITFEGLTTESPVPAGYAGLTWGTSSLDAVPGTTGYWQVRNDSSYATPASPVNYVNNAYGPDQLWFSFPGPTFFNGAWFAPAFALPDARATQVRFTDDLGHISPWLDLTPAPQYLAANFPGATTVYVERRGGTDNALFGKARWYTMDDVTYGQCDVPEAGSLVLAITGGLPLAGLVIRRNRS